MNSRPLPWILALASTVAVAPWLHADPLTVTLSWSFTEVYAGTNTPVANPNGIIEPGEAARIALTVSYTPVAGTVVQIQPGPATVAGFGTSLFDLVGSNAAQGSWSHLGRDPAWSGAHGQAAPDGSALHGLLVLQLPGPGVAPDPQNPIESIWWGAWMPDIYSPRMTTFASTHTSPQPTGGTSMLFVEHLGSYFPVEAQTNFGSIHIPIVPSPGSGVILTLAGALALRRSR
jgi:hypothetical protein